MAPSNRKQVAAALAASLIPGRTVPLTAKSLERALASFTIDTEQSLAAFRRRLLAAFSSLSLASPPPATLERIRARMTVQAVLTLLEQTADRAQAPKKLGRATTRDAYPSYGLPAATFERSPQRAEWRSEGERSYGGAQGSGARMPESLADAKRMIAYKGFSKTASLAERGTIERGPVLKVPAPTKKAVAKKVPAKKVAAKKAAKEAVDAPATQAPEPTRSVRATPHLDFAGEPLAGGAQPLMVFLDQETPEEGSATRAVELTVPQSLKSCRIQCWADCSSHFVLADLPADAALTLDVASGVSDMVRFTLGMAEPLAVAAAAEEPMSVTVFFEYEGRASGKVTRFLELRRGRLAWKRLASAAKAKAAKKQAPARGEVVLPNADAPAAMALDPGAVPADLRVVVTRRSRIDDSVYRVRTSYGAEMTDEKWPFRSSTREVVEERMQQFMANGALGQVASLRSSGVKFWETLPDKTRALIEKAAAGPAKTMLVQSEEPYIPWELMLPGGKGAAPLGVRFRMGRWVTGDYQAPPQRVGGRTAFLIVPKDSGLENAPKEMNFLLDLSKSTLDAHQLTPATIEGINAGLCGSRPGIVHLICHGSRTGSLQLLLLDEEGRLDCEQVLQLAGFQEAFAARPLVFLNACEVGGAVPALDGVGGFANSFIELQAAAVVAPLWAVRDSAAFAVTKEFYTRVLEGHTFAEALGDIRARAYSGQESNDTLAAYCFYGDPLARLDLS